MTPFWIVNFLEEDACESFFQSYWESLLQNTTTGPAPLKFFHITDGKADGMTKEQLNEIAFQRLSMSSPEAEKLIPAFTSNQGNSINVIFVGDVTQPKTITRFHTWAKYLQEQRMADINRPWFSISSVRMYGILLRPASVTVDDKTVTKEVSDFLNDLSAMQRLQMNDRPFEKILFLQSSMTEEGRKAAEQAVNIAALHIARTDGQCFNDYDIQYYDGNATAVFFEADVQREIDAYNLSAIVLKDLTTNIDEHFLDVKEARAFVDDNQSFIDTFKPMNTKRFFVSDGPHIPNMEITRFHTSLHLHHIIPIWREYNTLHIEKVINNVTQELSSFEKDFVRSLNLRQHKFIFDSSHGLQELVFQMFCDKGNPRYKHISLPQSMKVLEHFQIKISDACKSLETPPAAFVLPGDLAKLVNKAQGMTLSSDALRTQLQEEMNKLDTYKWTTIISSGIAGLAISAGLFPVIGWWSMFAFLLAFLGGAISFILKIKRLERLKDLFVGVKLCEIRKRLDTQAQKLHEKTVEEMKQYMRWLHEKKLVRLQNEMKLLTPPEFNFQQTKAFQPLLSGSFGNQPLVANVPTVQLYSDVDGGTIGIPDLAKGYKSSVQGLVKELMYSDETIADTEEENVQFQAHQTNLATRRMLLLLDVSGSMSADMNDLKKYVHELETIGEIEWIAFDEDVVASSRSASVDALKAGGGTNYIPAIERAVEWSQTSEYDMIMLLSDGCPFEELDDIVAAAQKLKMPLNTVAVGSAAEDVLINIALRTGGKEVTVDSFDQIRTPDVWNNEILPNVELVNKGEYSFGELMKHIQLDACASALHKFALNRIGDYSLTLPAIICGYINQPGFAEWLQAAAQRNTLSLQAEQMRDVAYFAAAESNEYHRLEEQLLKLCNMNNTAARVHASKSEPDTIVSLLSLRPLTAMSDLQWASAMKFKD